MGQKLRYAYWLAMPDENYPDQIPACGEVVLIDDRTKGCSRKTWYLTDTVAGARRAARKYNRDHDARYRRIDRLRRSLA